MPGQAAQGGRGENRRGRCGGGHDECHSDDGGEQAQSSDALLGPPGIPAKGGTADVAVVRETFSKLQRCFTVLHFCWDWLFRKFLLFELIYKVSSLYINLYQRRHASINFSQITLPIRFSLSYNIYIIYICMYVL